MDSWTDPWGNPYQYLNISNAGAPRQSQFLNNLNEYYDVYSLGPDGITTQVVSDAEGQDDIVLANDGGWIGSRRRILALVLSGFFPGIYDRYF